MLLKMETDSYWWAMGEQVLGGNTYNSSITYPGGGDRCEKVRGVYLEQPQHQIAQDTSSPMKIVH